MPHNVIQGCFPRGVTVQPHTSRAVPPNWVQERIAAGGRFTAPAAQPKAAAPRLSPNGTTTQLPPHFGVGASRGEPLPPAVRQKMEAAFGQRFADVRIHVGAQAPSIGALAYTQGSNIHFAPGQYAPSTPRGQQILAHELAHVVQQRSGRVRNPFGSGVAVVQDHALEAEAERMSQRVMTYRPVVQRSAASSSSSSSSFSSSKQDLEEAYLKAVSEGNDKLADKLDEMMRKLPNDSMQTFGSYDDEDSYDLTYKNKQIRFCWEKGLREKLIQQQTQNGKLMCGLGNNCYLFQDTGGVIALSKDGKEEWVSKNNNDKKTAPPIDHYNSDWKDRLAALEKKGYDVQTFQTEGQKLYNAPSLRIIHRYCNSKRPKA
jgi:hypothetical protein